MALDPRHEYSAMIYAELLSSIGAALVALMGSEVALGVFSRVARPVGVRDAKMLAGILGVKPGNAASAGVIAYSAARALDLGVDITALGPHRSVLSIGKCLYGDSISHYKSPLVCAVCIEYNLGIADAAGGGFRRSDKRISGGYGSCTSFFDCQRPAHLQCPNMARVNLIIRLAKILSDKNELLVSTMAALFVGLGRRTCEVMGDSAALIPARRAYEAGVFHCSVFSGALGLSDDAGSAASIVSSVRETLGCGVRVNPREGGFSVVTRKCPQAASCVRGGFLEVACVSYTRGLVSRWGDFEVVSDICSGICIQEFNRRRALFSSAVSGAGRLGEKRPDGKSAGPKDAS